MRYLHLALVILAVLFVAVAPDRLQAGECDSSLIYDKYSSFTSIEDKLAFIRSIDREMYRKIIDSEGRGGDISVAGFKVNASEGYEKFDERRGRFLESLDFSYSKDQTDAYLVSVLSDNSKEAYVECIRATSVGVRIILSDTTPMASTLRILRLTQGPVGEVPVQIDVFGGKVQTQAPDTSDFSFEGNYILTRDIECSELRVVVNIGGFSDRAFSPCIPEVTLPETVLSDHVVAGKPFNVTFDQGQCVDPGCGVDYKVSKMGALKWGETYSVYYIPATHEWVTRGPRQSVANCPVAGPPLPPRYSARDPRTTISLWGRMYQYNELGEVMEISDDRQNCMGKGAVVGRILGID